MWLRVAIVLIIALVAAVLAQNDGRYRPPPTRASAGDGSYRGGNDGRYRGGGDGRYSGGNDGRYVHMDNKYKHQRTAARHSHSTSTR